MKETPETKRDDDPVSNWALSATRLQQAERVRHVAKKLSSRLSKAKLKRAFKQHPNKVLAQLAKAYPMHQLYQVRALALLDKTYPGSIGIIASYQETGGVTMIVLYDRPGHKYTSAQQRHTLDPKWLEAITLEDFEKVVEKDNPTVVLS